MGQRRRDKSQAKPMSAGKYGGVHYEAVSWCWGKDTPDRAIILKSRMPGGSLVSTKKNVSLALALALKYLRPRDIEKDRILWVS
jgi:hypothetical protein